MAKTIKKALASVLAIVIVMTTLPMTAITASAADSVTYNFTEETEASNAYKDFSENGHAYALWGNNGTAKTDGNSLILQNSACMFINDETVRGYFQDGAFSVVFKGRHHAETTRVLGTVSTPDKRFVRLDSNGDFYVNNAKATTIDLVGGANNTYAFSYDGANTVELYVNGIKRATVNATLDIPNDGTRYVSLGWADGCGDKMDNASFDYLTISDSVYDPSEFTSDKKASATSAGDVKTGNAKAYFEGNEMSNDYYSNLLYCSNTTSWNSWSSRGTIDNFAYLNDSNWHLSMKLVVPTKTVMMYDGKNDSYIGVKAESRVYKDNNEKARYYNYIASGNEGFEYKANWKYNWTAWNTWDPSGLVEGDTEYTGYSSATEHQMRKLDNTGSLFFFNKLYLSKYMSFESKNFIEVQPKADVKICGDTYTTVSNNEGKIYVVNYKPIADIYKTVKEKVAEVASKEANYESVDEFYSAASNLLNLDPNAYGYGNTYYDVLACASDIKQAVIDYNAVELKEIKSLITYRVDGEEKQIEDVTNDKLENILYKTNMQSTDSIFNGWKVNDEFIGNNVTSFDKATAIDADYTPIGSIGYQDPTDEKVGVEYKSFGLVGAQIRSDYCKEVAGQETGSTYGGLRFVASFSEELIRSLGIVQYGFVVATEDNARINANGDLNYVIKSGDKNVKRYDCTSGKNNIFDHRNFDGYRLFTFVIDYKDNESLKSENVVVRPYIIYTDANGTRRIFYGSYGGTNTYGGLSISYNAASAYTDVNNNIK